MAKNMTVGNPAKLIFMFTIPLIVGNIFQQLYVVADTFIVGRTMGVNALAAVGSSTGIIFLMMGFVMGLTAGFAIVTGQKYGAGDKDGVRRSAATCMVLSAIATVILTVIGLVSAKYVLELMQTPPEIIDDAYTFIMVLLAGIVATVLFNMLSNIMRSLGDSRTPLFFLIFASVINVVLELFFILVLNMGIGGAALSTVLAQLISGLLCMAYIIKYMPALRLKRSDLKLSREELWEHIRLGLPMGFQASIIAVGAIILQIALNNLGPEAIAAYAAAQKVDLIANMPMMSFGMAMAAYTAQNYGAGNMERIKSGVNQCMIMSVSFGVLMGIINVSCGAWLVAGFVGDDAGIVIELAQQYLNINGFCYWILALLFIYRYTLQGIGQSFVPTLAGIMELIMRTFAALIMAQWLGFVGVCTASPLAWAGSCIPLAIAYYITMRKKLRQEA